MESHFGPFTEVVRKIRREVTRKIDFAGLNRGNNRFYPCNQRLIWVAISIEKISAIFSNRGISSDLWSGIMPLPRSAFVRTARAVTVGASFLFAANAFTQEPAPVPATRTMEAERVIVTGEELERVILTGSAIPTSELVGPNPILNLDRNLINKSGQGTTTEQLLKSQPIASANSIPVQNNATGVGGPAGAASVSLRGFDPGATLVLIDGRRVAPYPGTSAGGAAFFDLNTIPIAAVQSIEIQKDGAQLSFFPWKRTQSMVRS